MEERKKSWWIVSTKDKMIPPDVERMMAKRAGSTITEIDASHAVYVSHAAEVAAVIEKAAAGRSIIKSFREVVRIVASLINIWEYRRCHFSAGLWRLRSYSVLL